ncbi:SUZ RNA-binding domain-containing-like isoform 1-T1 [Clarias gariepinus]|uniref:SUZ domain-containing protein 1-like isoform X1 n=1 Tax=Clarias gariepinus TaxID=13013 RepID=UPI00234E1FCB|nr:SUZ domain-containing protein 1-like isoform X1 [Clarias gariepinus]
MEDEDVSDNWEEAADSGEIERRLEAKLKMSQKSESVPVKTGVVIQDESLPAAPPPQIRILKRPPSNGILNSPGASTRPTQQPKSLKQREAEYAEARRRILGSASAEEPVREREDSDRSATDPLQTNSNVIRQPRGPDGTSGFRLSR